MTAHVSTVRMRINVWFYASIYKSSTGQRQTQLRALTLEKTRHVYALSRVKLQGAKSPTYAELNYLRQKGPILLGSEQPGLLSFILPRRSSYPQLREDQIGQRLLLSRYDVHFCSRSFILSALLTRGRKLVGSRRKVISRDARNWFMPLSND